LRKDGIGKSNPANYPTHIFMMIGREERTIRARIRPPGGVAAMHPEAGFNCPQNTKNTFLGAVMGCLF